MTAQPAGYSRLQIALHWIVFALVAFQIIAHDGIKEAWEAFEDGQAVNPGDNILAFLHVWSGVAILAFVLWRLALRFTRGVPAAPEGESQMQKMIAGATHVALYLVLIVAAVSGGIMWFGGIEDAGEIHEIAKPAVLILVGLHVAGALAQHFVFKSDVMKRMMRPAA